MPFRRMDEVEGEEIAELMYRLRRRLARVRRLANRILTLLITPLSVILLLLGVVAWVFELFGLWAVPLVMYILAAALSICTIIYYLLRKLARSISARLRELARLAREQGIIEYRI